MLIYCKVIPNAKRNKVIKTTDKDYRIYLTSSPQEGRANKALISLLADFFEISKAQIQILKGEKDRNKEIWIEN